MREIRNNIKDLYSEHSLDSGTCVGMVRFADMDQCLELMNKNYVCKERGAKWDHLFCVEDDNYDNWRYGKSFPSREKTCEALSHGKIDKAVLREYTRQRSLIERKIGINNIVGKGMSCK